MSMKLRGLAAAALGLMCAASAVAQDLPSVNLTVTGGNRTQNMFRYIEEPFFTKELTEASNGAITTTFGSLDDAGIQGPELLRLLGLGMFDMAEGTLSYMAGEAPEFESLDLPGLTGDIAEQRKMANALRDDLANIMAEKFNVKLLTMSPIALQVLYCNKPVSGIKDLAGLKVRTFSRSMAELVEGLGAQSVNIPFAEVVPALDRGVADCAITATSAGNTARWWEVTDHLVILPMGWSMIFFGANIDNWNKQTPETQAFLTTKFAEMEDRMWAQATADVQDGINCNTAQGECTNGIKAERGMTLVELSEADRSAVAQIVTDKVLHSWADRCGAECVTNWNAKAGSIIGVEIAGN